LLAYFSIKPACKKDTNERHGEKFLAILDGELDMAK
jgi:hypothetical protein